MPLLPNPCSHCSFRIYYNRLEAPQVRPEQRPPPLRLGSHWQLWSWLIPVFSVSDEQLLEQCGLDALVSAWGLCCCDVGYPGRNKQMETDWFGHPLMHRTSQTVPCPTPRMQVAQRVMGFGCMCMLPLTVLGVAV